MSDKRKPGDVFIEPILFNAIARFTKLEAPSTTKLAEAQAAALFEPCAECRTPRKLVAGYSRSVPTYMHPLWCDLCVEVKGWHDYAM